MKMLFLSTLVFSSVVLAQDAPVAPSVPSPPRRVRTEQMPAPVQAGASSAATVLEDNYELTLVMVEKDGPPTEFSIVTASTNFQATLMEPSPSLTFTGSFAVEEDGRLLVNYALGWESREGVENGVAYRHSSTQGSVRLKLGEEVPIVRAGTRAAKLSVKKLEAAKVK